MRPERRSDEALADRPREALSEALKALGIGVTLDEMVAPPTARLADARDADWIARFLKG